jgi:hypothetical protein
MGLLDCTKTEHFHKQDSTQISYSNNRDKHIMWLIKNMTAAEQDRKTSAVVVTYSNENDIHSHLAKLVLHKRD